MICAAWLFAKAVAGQVLRNRQRYGKHRTLARLTVYMNRSFMIYQDILCAG